MNNTTSFQLVSNKKKYCYLCKKNGHIQTDFTKNIKNEIIYICPLVKNDKTKLNNKDYKTPTTTNNANKFEALFATTPKNKTTSKSKKEEFPELFVKPKDADEIIMPTFSNRTNKSTNEKNIWKSILLTKQPTPINNNDEIKEQKQIVFIADNKYTKDVKIPPKLLCNLQQKTQREKEYDEWTKTHFQKYLEDDPQQLNLYAKEFQYNQKKYDLLQEEYLDLSTEDDDSEYSGDSNYAIPV